MSLRNINLLLAQPPDQTFQVLDLQHKEVPTARRRHPPIRYYTRSLNAIAARQPVLITARSRR